MNSVLSEYYDRQIPDYYPTMYLDGYSPQQILHSLHRKMYNEYLERKEEAEIPVFTIQSVVKMK